MGIKLSQKCKQIITYTLSALGAAGGALQNYSAMELFLRGLSLGWNSLSTLYSGMIQVFSIAGGACNGLVNYFINVDLLEGFLHRITRNKEAVKLTGWRKFRYYAGLFIFSITGVLFGMMAFAFSAATPLGILALASGLFVTIIMTIQELETWLQSFDETVLFLSKTPSLADKDKVTTDNQVLIVFSENKYTLGFCNKHGKYEEQPIENIELIEWLEQEEMDEGLIENTLLLEKINHLLNSIDSCSQKRSLKDIFNAWWSTLTFKKACGHLIAAGNVLALSLLFTLSLVDVLVMFQVAALPALVIGLSVAFTVGAFTEFYFYNFFLAKFCKQFDEQWKAMQSTHYAPLGYACITVNALVNGALTYAGVSLLTNAFVLAGIALPPLGIIIGIASVSAVFAASASFILGMDFWIRKCSKPIESVPETAAIPCTLVQPKPTVSQEPRFTPGLSFLQTMNPMNRDLEQTCITAAPNTGYIN